MVEPQKICFIDTIGLLFTGDTVYKRGLGGSESATIYMAEELTKLGYFVTVYNKCEQEGVYAGVEYVDLSRIRAESRVFDVLISIRSCLPFVPQIYGEAVWDRYNVDIGPFTSIVNNARHKVVWLHDTFVDGEEFLEPMLVDGIFHEVFCLSDWHTDYISRASHWQTAQRRYEQMNRRIYQTRNGIRRHIDEVDLSKKDPDLFVYNSSISKGMIPLLKEVWPKVKKLIPTAKLKVIGGYYNFAGKDDGPDEQELLFHKTRAEHHGTFDIEFTGVITQKQIAEIMAEATFMIYPPIFPETYGISTLEAINYNTLPITSIYGALEEVAMDQVSYLMNYEVNKDADQIERFVRLVKQAYDDKYLIQQKQNACNEIKEFSGWDSVAKQWKQHFNKVLEIFPERFELEDALYISSNVNRIFGRKNINYEEQVEFSRPTSEQEIFVITPVYNAEEYIAKCIKSVALQFYDNYCQVIVDDMSTDGTLEMAQRVINSLDPRLRDKFLIVQNNAKSSALENQVKIIENIESSKAIVVLLDGDDWLTNDPYIFRYINDLYYDKTEMTYGSCHSLADNIDLIAQIYPESVKASFSYRDHHFTWGIPYTHLRTFSKDLFDRIDQDLIKDEGGRYYGPGGDGALFYALIEQADPDKVKAIQRILVQYNDISPLNDYKVNAEEQTSNQKKIQLRRPNKYFKKPKGPNAVPYKQEKIIDELSDVYEGVLKRNTEAVDRYKHIIEDRNDAWLDQMDGPFVVDRLAWLENEMVRQEIPKDAKILDVGSWSGAFSNHFYQKGWRNITCLDISKKNVELGKKSYPWLNWIRADIEEIELRQKYDIIIVFEILEHLVDPIATIQKLKGSLTPGGRIIFTIPTEDVVFNSREHISSITSHDLNELLASYEIIESEVYKWYAGTIFKEIELPEIETPLNPVSENKTRILIGIPTAKYIETETFMSIYNLDKPENAMVDLQYFYGYNIAQIRNLMAHYAIHNGYDYMLWVDSDMVLPQDTLTKLLSHKKNIISGVYIQRRADAKVPEIYMHKNGGVLNADLEEVTDKGVIEIAGAGFGCILTRVPALADIGYPQFEYHNALDHINTVSEDVDFALKAAKKGYKLFADTSIVCEHIGATKFIP